MPSDPTPSRVALRHRHLWHRALRGCHPALPPVLDRVSDWWAGRPPRVRTLLVLLGVVAALGVAGARIHAAQVQWGGPPVEVLVAAQDLWVGDRPERLRRIDVPPALVPPEAVRTPPVDGVLAMALPEGTVLTTRHLAETGPSVGLSPELRAVPIPVEEGWGVVAGGWVDVWVLEDRTGDAAGGGAAALSRPVLDLREDDMRLTALVGLAPAEVRLVTRSLAEGRLLLAHAPPPSPGRAADPRPPGR